MFDKDKVIKPIMFGDINEIVDEKGSMFIALRKVQWVSDDKEPDESKAKLEIRKWLVDADGEEKANKGVTFLTDEGPHELAKVLVKKGFGKTKEILKALKPRADFKDSVKNLFKDDDADNQDGDYFDMRTALLEDYNQDESEE